ncbi:MAG: T9SS type A sorting domain-containing protein [Bacteroidetes bacterium]|nr:T9SS type A sorting domain-containing protein [Bacteroidota bacterium]
MHGELPSARPGHPGFHALHHAPQAAGGQRGGAPPNDEACDAPVDALAVGGSVDWSGSLAGATDSEDLGAPTVWQAFTITECADVTLDWCGTAPVINLVIMFDGACDALNDIYWPADPSPECVDGNLITTFYGLAPGNYYLLIGDWDGVAGTYSIHASASACPPPPPNDNPCDVVPDALAVGSNASWSGTMAGATDQEGYGATSVWEAFTLAECADVTFNWCGSSTPDMAWDFQLVTGDCNDIATWNTFYASMSIVDCGDGNLISTAYGLEAGTYYVMIMAGPVDTYTADVSAVTCQPPPANDLCGDVESQALPIGGSLTFTGVVATATADGDFDPSFPGDPTVHTVWHAFTTTECANVTVSYCAMEAPYYTVFSFLSSFCPADSSIILGSSDWAPCNDLSVTIQYWDLPAGTYYLPVGDLDGFDLPYTVNVGASACGPYCAAWALNTNPYFEKISQVTFAGIDHASTLGTGYEAFLEDTAQVVRSGSYPITVALSNGYEGDQVLAWIDFDGDEVFQEDELVFSSEVGAGPYTGNVTIPADATIGNTRMRLRMHDAGHPDWANDAPCGMADYGQVEDYTVRIDLGTGIAEAVHGRFTAMPNPANDHLSIAFAPGTHPAQLTLLDATGRAVLEQIVTSDPVHLDLAGMDHGLYVVHVRFSDGTQAVERVVKE